MRRVDGEAEESHQGGRRDREISHPRGGLPKLIIPHFLVMCCSIFTNFLFFNQYHYFAFLPSFFYLRWLSQLVHVVLTPERNTRTILSSLKISEG